MLNHVLLTLDGTTESEAAMKLVRRFLAHSETGSLTLLHVVAEDRGTHRETALAEARQELNKLPERLGLRNVSVTPRVIAGNPVEVIADVAAQLQPDVVAMATHARTGFDRWLNGSVTEGVLRVANRPLLVGNSKGLSLAAGDAPFHKLLVPVDGGPVSAQVLPLATKVALQFGAEVILLRIVPKASDEACGYLEQLGQTLKDRGVEQVHMLLQDGDPTKRILEAVETYRCDLVVMGSEGRTGLDRLRFGSVAEGVLRECPAPLLIQRGDD